MPDTVVVIAQEGARIPANLVVAAPDLPVALLQAPVNSELIPSTTRPIDGLRMGESLLAVARPQGGNHVFLSGSCGGYTAAVCGDFAYRRLLSSMSLSEAMLGGGVFDLDGNLIAVIVRCGASPIAMAAADVGSLLREGATLRGQMLRRYGFYAQPLDAATKAYYRTEEGVWISEVWKGFAGERAGLQPGDLLLAAAGAPLTDMSGLNPLVQPGTPEAVELTVRRGTRNVAITLARQQAPAPSPAAEDGVVLESPASGYAVTSVAVNSRAAAAGLRSGDRIVRIGNTPVSSPDAVRRLLAAQRDTPTFVLVDRSEKLAGIFF
jgi:serine protease Do